MNVAESIQTPDEEFGGGNCSDPLKSWILSFYFTYNNYLLQKYLLSVFLNT